MKGCGILKSRRISGIALILAISIGMGVLFSTRITAAAAPSLFHNDERWYRDASAGLEVIGGICYVPVDIFSMFRQIEFSIDSKNGEFMVYNRNTGCYISVLYKEKMATVNGEEESYLNLYQLHGEYYYVPAEYFCSILSLQCESVRSSNERSGITFRIYDELATKTLSELLQSYDSGLASVTDTQETTTPNTTQPPVSNTDTTQRTNYLTFNSLSPSFCEQILAILAEHQIQATFFLTEEEIRSMPESVAAITAGGHALGIRITNTGSAAQILTEANAANESLTRLVKRETRLLQTTDQSASTLLSESDWEAVSSAGYVMWDWSYDVPDSAGYSSAYVETLCKSEILKHEINVLRIGCNATVVRLLPGLLEFLHSGAHYTTMQISVCETDFLETHE